MYYSYIKKILLIVFNTLILFSIINFFVDPEQVYPKLFSNNNPVLKKFSNNNPVLKIFSKELTSSKYGIINKFSKLNERDRKKGLAMFSEDADCAIIGSSHVMQISSFSEDKSLTEYCKSIINLGVSGGTLEDYFAFSNMLLKNKNTIGTIVFGVDPWSLKFDSDQRWNHIKNDFDKMKNRLKIKWLNPNSPYTESLILNLINLEYLIESLDKLTSIYRLMDKDKETFIHAEKFDLNKGISGSSVTLPDGSHAYSSEYINEQKLYMKTFDGFNDYKISQLDGARWYDDNAINDLTNLVKFLQSKFNILFVMTPYHPKVWEHQQPTVEAMKTIENKVHMLAKQLNVKVIGTYNPVKIGCSKDEFSDGMHATSKCLKKLERKVLKR